MAAAAIESLLRENYKGAEKNALKSVMKSNGNHFFSIANGASPPIQGTRRSDAWRH